MDQIRTIEEANRMRVEYQRLLVGFLNTDLDLGFTFASRHNGKSAAQVVGAIRHFKDRVEDDEERKEIERKLSDLEQLVSAM